MSARPFNTTLSTLPAWSGAAVGVVALRPLKFIIRSLATGGKNMEIPLPASLEMTRKEEHVPLLAASGGDGVKERPRGVRESVLGRFMRPVSVPSCTCPLLILVMIMCATGMFVHHCPHCSGHRPGILPVPSQVLMRRLMVRRAAGSCVALGPVQVGHC